MNFTITEPPGLETKHRAMLIKLTSALSEPKSQHLLHAVYAALVMKRSCRGADTPAEMFVADLLTAWDEGGLPLTPEYVRQALKEFKVNFEDVVDSVADFANRNPGAMEFAKRYPEAVAAAQAGREEAE